LLLLLGYFLWKRAVFSIVPSIAKGVRGNFETRVLLSTSLSLWGVTLIPMVMGSIDQIFLGVWAGSEASGIYGVAKRISLLTNFILVAVSSISAPKISELYARGDLDTLGRLARNAARIAVIMTFPIFLGIILFPAQVLRLFGDEFALGGASTLVILVIGQFANVAAGLTEQMLTMTGHEKAMRNIIFVTLVFQIIISVLLIPRFSAAGAALAYSTSIVFANILASIAIYQRLSIIVFPISKPPFMIWQ
jgi:O-antigen/teichoic acid export membrane protein